MSTVQQSLVSVIIGTFNRRHYLPQAIDSVLGQTFQSFELIIVDDGSTDGTMDMVSELYSQRVRYVYQPNQGRSAARNLGMSMATGKYIAFLDSDDSWIPEKLAKQFAFMERYPEYGVTHTFSEVMHEDGTTDQAGTVQRRQHYKQAVKRGYTYEGMSYRCIMFLSTVMIRSDTVKDIGLMDTEIPAFEDWDWYLRAARVTEIGTLPDVLTRYRIHHGNSTNAEFSIGEVHTSQKHLKLSVQLPVQKRSIVQRNLYLHLAAAAYKQEQSQECTRWFLKAAALAPLTVFRPENFRYTLTALVPARLIHTLRRLNRRLTSR